MVFIYVVESGVAVLQGFDLSDISKEKSSWIWNLGTKCLEIKMFLWKLYLEGLPTKKILQVSHVFIPIECVSVIITRRMQITFLFNVFLP